MSRKPIAFFLLAPFGVGKTSLVNYRGHEQIIKEYSVVDNMISPGGTRGTDSLNGYGVKKRDWYANFMPYLLDRDILYHGVFYSSRPDFDIMAKTHRVVGIHLKTSEYNVMKRITGRGGKFKSDTYTSVAKRVEKLKTHFKDNGYEYITIDNDRDFNTVALEVWALLDRLRYE